MSPEDKKLDKLVKALELANEDTVSSEEVVQLFEVVVATIKDIRVQLRKEIEDNGGKLSDNLESTNFLIKEVEAKLEGVINKVKQNTLGEIKSLNERFNTEIDRVESLIPETADLSPLERRINEVERKIPIVKDVDLSPLETGFKQLKKEWDDRLTRLNDLERIARANAQSLPITTTHVYKNGELVGRAKNLNFTGEDISVSVSGDTAQVVLGGGGHVIQDDSVSMTQRRNLNFVGFDVSDDAGNNATVIELPEGETVETVDISSQFDGIVTTFTIPAYTEIVAFLITGWPPNGVLRPTVDFTTPTSTTVALVTSQVSAPEAGTTGIIIYKATGGSGGGGGGSGTTLTKQTVTGTVDDSNTTFTVAIEPLYIVVNGSQYAVGEGLYTSYVAGTITLSSPVGTGGFITSYYNA